MLNHFLLTTQKYHNKVSCKVQPKSCRSWQVPRQIRNLISILCSHRSCLPKVDKKKTLWCKTWILVNFCKRRLNQKLWNKSPQNQPQTSTLIFKSLNHNNKMKEKVTKKRTSRSKVLGCHLMTTTRKFLKIRNPKN